MQSFVLVKVLFFKINVHSLIDICSMCFDTNRPLTFACVLSSPTLSGTLLSGPLKPDPLSLIRIARTCVTLGSFTGSWETCEQLHLRKWLSFPQRPLISNRPPARGRASWSPGPTIAEILNLALTVGVAPPPCRPSLHLSLLKPAVWILVPTTGCSYSKCSQT